MAAIVGILSAQSEKRGVGYSEFAQDGSASGTENCAKFVFYAFNVIWGSYVPE